MQHDEIAFQMEQTPRSRALRGPPHHRRVALGPALHLRHDRPAEGRAARPLLHRLAVPDRQVGARSAPGRHLLVQRRSRAGSPARRYGIIGPWVERRDAGGARRGFHADRWYEFIEKHRVTVWYSAPTAIRMLMKEGAEIVRKHDLSSLRHLCSVGEPLNAEAVHLVATRRSACRSTTRSGRPKPAAS